MSKTKQTTIPEPIQKVQFLLRLPANLRSKLEAEAQRERRSLTAQLIHILEERYESAAADPMKRAS